ncbi:hypothetical protein JL475_06425 [Streptomyces sp. M2CJ-2]|uniref:hypothetical protein n=1 Tax=Streptomyces sp. M2CJ-2 TaxID=2803948 RepID=UPI001920787B|nr:hypothetical protein [Streptomyces sp. M2CJ-2]MBL3665642.1 hypothetical protein [Streptomyces sp. M2CJ-2]
MNSTDDLMTRARQALADEESARLQAKADELATADERARLQAERQAQREKAKADAEVALSAEGVTLPDLADKLDDAVAALVDLAEAACNRNEVIRQHAAGLQAAQLPDAQRTSAGLMLARAAILAAAKIQRRDDADLRRLLTDLTSITGPLSRSTVVERARRS